MSPSSSSSRTCRIRVSWPFWATRGCTHSGILSRTARPLRRLPSTSRSPERVFRSAISPSSSQSRAGKSRLPRRSSSSCPALVSGQRAICGESAVGGRAAHAPIRYWCRSGSLPYPIRSCQAQCSRARSSATMAPHRGQACALSRTCTKPSFRSSEEPPRRRLSKSPMSRRLNTPGLRPCPPTREWSAANRYAHPQRTLPDPESSGSR